MGELQVEDTSETSRNIGHQVSGGGSDQLGEIGLVQRDDGGLPTGITGLPKDSV